jgi:hypothetical protein
VERVTKGLENVEDYLITGPVMLIAYNKSNQTVTFQRANGKQETLSPIEVFDPS